jgi:AcrR family transcriptional regulator
MISKEGLKRLTLRALGHQVGVSRTAPYRYFANKDALLFAIAEEGFNELTTRYREINRDESIDALSKLQHIGLAYIEFAIQNPGAFRLMFGQEITRHQRSEKLCVSAGKTFSEYLTAVKAFQDDKKIIEGDLTVLANYSWATVHGLAMLILDGQIQVHGEHYGLPRLLTDSSSSVMVNEKAMITFSKQTLANFWDMMLNGILQKK